MQRREFLALVLNTLESRPFTIPNLLGPWPTNVVRRRTWTAVLDFLKNTDILLLVLAP